MPSISEIIASKNGHMDELLATFEKQYNGFASKLQRELVALFRAGTFDRDSILAAFSGNGFTEIVDDFVTRQGELLQYAGELSTALGTGFNLGARSIRLLELVADQNVGNLLDARDSIVSAMMDAGLKNELDGLPFRSIVQSLQERVDELGRRLAVEAQTGISIFDRTIKSEQFAEGDVQRFIYVGPLDYKTRQNCADVLTDSRNTDEQGFTRDDILGLDGVDFVTGGGYNCRHEWLPAVPGAQAVLDEMAGASDG